jgi:ankyrin repeat protein
VTKDWELAIQNGDLVRIDVLLKQKSNLDSRDKHGQTALMNAAKLGLIPIVRCLINEGADLNVKAKYGLTALMLAIINDRKEVAIAQIEAGADIGLKGSGAPGFAGKTALDLALERDQSDVVALLEASV